MKTLFSNRWKRTLLCGLLLTLYAIPTPLQAQTIGKTYRKPSPGIYTMTQLCGEDGVYIPSPFEQYKFVDKSRNLYDLAFLNGEMQRGEDGQTAFILHKEKYTTHISGSTSPIQLFDTGKKGFKLKWFQNLSHYKLFPKGTFVTEKWTAELQTPTARLLKEVMDSKKNRKNPLFGAWKLVGTDRCPHKNARPQDECVVPTYKAPKHYSLKIYGKEASVLVPPQGQTCRDDHMYITSGTIRYTEYYGKDTTKENGTPCYIEWMDANTIKLTFKNIPSGTVYHEMWERFTMPVQLGF